MDRPVMNVAVSSSREYSRYLLVMLTSIYENHPDILVHCYVLHEELTAEDKLPLTEYVHSRGHEITFIEVDPACVEYFPVIMRWPRVVICRTLLHLFLPKHLERVFVLGIDIIVSANIWDFYNCDFDGNYIISPGDPDAKLKGNIRPYNQGNNNLLCADIMIWNLELFRRNVTAEDCFKAFREASLWVQHDEHLLNYMFWDKVRHVRFNSYVQQSKHNRFPHLTSNDSIPYIIHYVGYYKPWDMLMTEDELERVSKARLSFDYRPTPTFTEYKNRLVAIWWEYAKMTPFYDDMYRGMQHTKAFFFRLFTPIQRMHANTFYCDMYIKLLDTSNLSYLLADYLSQNNIKTVAIYGYGGLGKLVYKKLTEDGSCVSVSYVIDRTLIDDPGIRRVGSGLERYEPVDLVIVTALNDYEIIKEALTGRVDCPIRSMAEIADGISES